MTMLSIYIFKKKSVRAEISGDHTLNVRWKITVTHDRYSKKDHGVIPRSINDGEFYLLTIGKKKIVEFTIEMNLESLI